MTNSHKMITRSQLKQYNSIFDRKNVIQNLFIRLCNENCIHLRLTYIHRIYEIQNSNFNVFVELGHNNSQIINLFDATYYNSFNIIPEIRERDDGTKLTSCYKVAIQEIEKYQIKFKTYVMTYLNNSLLPKLNDDVISVIYEYLY